MKTRIHVNQHRIRSNIGKDNPEPVLTVKTYKSNRYAFAVDVKGPSRIVYQPQSPLSCGARCWVETEADVEIVD